MRSSASSHSSARRHLHRCRRWFYPDQSQSRECMEASTLHHSRRLTRRNRCQPRAFLHPATARALSRSPCLLCSHQQDLCPSLMPGSAGDMSSAACKPDSVQSPSWTRFAPCERVHFRRALSVAPVYMQGVGSRRVPAPPRTRRTIALLCIFIRKHSLRCVYTSFGVAPHRDTVIRYCASRFLSRTELNQEQPCCYTCQDENPRRAGRRGFRVAFGPRPGGTWAGRPAAAPRPVA